MNRFCYVLSSGNAYRQALLHKKKQMPALAYTSLISPFNSNKLMKLSRCCIVASCCVIVSFRQLAIAQQLRVAVLFSDHMVLQQKKRVAVWGQCAAGEQVTVSASWGKRAAVITDAGGNWKLNLATPAAGGPYSITIRSRESSIVLNDVLVGEVWLASGQSNMDIPLRGWPPGDTILNSQQEIADAAYPNIRFRKVPFNMAVHPTDSAGGAWAVVSPATAGDFSATAYFYARQLYRELHVPIGIIQSSIGGTPAEAWTSKDYLNKLGDFDEALNQLEQLQQSTGNWFNKWPVQPLPENTAAWKQVDFNDVQAAAPAFAVAAWTTVQLPGSIDRLGSADIDGAFWVRREFMVTDTTTDYVLKIGGIDDMDATYINGQYIGGLVGQGAANAPREMAIPQKLLVKGRNVIAIRVIDTGGAGAVHGPMRITSDKTSILLEGEWKWRPVAELLHNRFYTYGLHADIAGRPDIHQLNSNAPSVLFNAMINPLIPYTIKGVIWYQGESNVGRAAQYKRLFPLLIKDWRSKWGYPFPFYFVQLAPFIYTAADQHNQSQKLRDAQRYALSLPVTGMVSTLDIGYLTTAHPPNKQEVGLRLARYALAYNYGKKIPVSGPLYKNAVASGNQVTVAFDFTGAGLLASARGLDNFEIAGAYKIYVKADARIVNNKVVLRSAAIPKPVYVRYAWSDSSSATLFNREGLPAATFSSEK